MARSLALVSDPAAPRSVVVLIGPSPRRCQRVLSTNRRTAEALSRCTKMSAISVAYAMRKPRALDRLTRNQCGTGGNRETGRWLTTCDGLRNKQARQRCSCSRIPVIWLARPFVARYPRWSCPVCLARCPKTSGWNHLAPTCGDDT